MDGEILITFSVSALKHFYFTSFKRNPDINVENLQKNSRQIVNWYLMQSNYTTLNKRVYSLMFVYFSVMKILLKNLWHYSMTDWVGSQRDISLKPGKWGWIINLLFEEYEAYTAFIAVRFSWYKSTPFVGLNKMLQ